MTRARGARSLLKEIMTSGRSKLIDIFGPIERLEDLMRRCCARRDAGGNGQALAEDIRVAARRRCYLKSWSGFA